MNTRINQLLQLVKVTWDGDLISKSARDDLQSVGLVTKCYGFNFLTSNGVKCLSDLGLLKEETPKAAAQGVGQFTAHNNPSTKLICDCCKLNDACDRLNSVCRLLGDCRQYMGNVIDGKLTSYIG